MVEMQGLSAASGVGIGKIYFISYQNRSIPEYTINKSDISSELERLHKALDSVDEELRLLYENLEEKETEKAQFIMAHRMILQDPLLHTTIERWLHEKLNNIESLLFRFATKIEQIFREMEDPMFAERSSDMQDVTHRVIDALLGHKRGNPLMEIKEDYIVVAYDLYPSDAVSLDPKYVKGIVTETGGVTSHTAILARAFGIPMVSGIENLLYNFHQESFTANCQVIVDGNKGKVFFDPDERNLNNYQLLQAQSTAHLNDYADTVKPIISSQDAQDVSLYANIGTLAELSNPFLSSASGIGLFRSEFLFLEKIPSEEEQYQVYVKIMESLDPKQEVTIRTSDLGGDKVPVTGLLTERNPLMGCRAIRLAMAYPEELFRPQIRALFRSAAYAAEHNLGKIRILLPMISNHTELSHAKTFIAETAQALNDEGLQVPKVSIGAMIELPSAALCTDIIAQEVDFLSIGTNDLVQYTLGIDRANEKMAYLYDPLQFGVLKLIQIAIISANREGVPVALCGEMASDLRATAILLGLGLRNFSMNSCSLPTIAHAISNFNILECEELAYRFISMHNYANAHKYLIQWHRERNINIHIPEWDIADLV